MDGLSGYVLHSDLEPNSLLFQHFLKSFSLSPFLPTPRNVWKLFFTVSVGSGKHSLFLLPPSSCTPHPLLLSMLVSSHSVFRHRPPLQYSPSSQNRLRSLPHPIDAISPNPTFVGISFTASGVPRFGAETMDVVGMPALFSFSSRRMRMAAAEVPMARANRGSRVLDEERKSQYGVWKMVLMARV